MTKVRTFVVRGREMVDKETLMDYEHDVGRKELFEEFLRGCDPKEVIKFHTHMFEVDGTQVGMDVGPCEFDENLYEFIEGTYYDEYWSFVRDSYLDSVELLNDESSMLTAIQQGRF